MMKVLAIDPSSSCTGYAVLSGLAVADLIDAGRLRPSEAIDQIAGPPWRRAWLGQGPLKAYRRVYSMIADLRDLIIQYVPDWIVVEVPSGLAGTGSRHGARASLATYGAAAGLIVGACDWFADSNRVVVVTERMWIRGGNTAKRLRQRAIAAVYRGRYEWREDAGADAADAIGLGRWWLSVGLRKLECVR